MQIKHEFVVICVSRSADVTIIQLSDDFGDVHTLGYDPQTAAKLALPDLLKDGSRLTLTFTVHQPGQSGYELHAALDRHQHLEAGSKFTKVILTLKHPAPKRDFSARFALNIPHRRTYRLLRSALSAGSVITFTGS